MSRDELARTGQSYRDRVSVTSRKTLLTSDSWLLAILECLDRLFPGVDNLANTVHADEVENHANGWCRSTQFEIAACWRNVLQA
jgi:hypothetical protein